jgi:alcohol dehydrogenase (cytochrome c)
MHRVASRIIAHAFFLLFVALGIVNAQPTGYPDAHERLRNFEPVTDAMLRNPDPGDWLMYSRTYDAQRYSPLAQINRDNVNTMTRVWSRPMADGLIEVIPIVYRGVMYLTTPGGRGSSSGVWALDAATGELLWEYQPEGSLPSRVKSIAIYQNMIYYTAPAARGEPSPVVALDAVTGEIRWQTPVTQENHTAGAIVVEGHVVSGRTCNIAREHCYIAAHDAITGEEVWRFHTTAGHDDPGDASWGNAPENERRASSWGLPGTYDAQRRLLYWGISNPMPNTRADRHGGDPDAIPRKAPADLYSNSTVALRPDTGELVWYYQHLPGDDWDMDVAHEKTLIRTPIEPDPTHVRWINPGIARGTERDVVITVPESGGLWVNDADTGEFIWATRFPFDTPHSVLSHIDVETGTTHINWDLVLKEPGANSLICYYNTRSFWPTAYHPGLNSLYVPYIDLCLDMTRSVPGESGGERRVAGLRPGADPARLAGLARIDMRTGQIHRIWEGRAASNGSVLVTAGGLVFLGDIMQILRAFDAETGNILWESEPLGATVQTSTITYAVNGRQYIAVVNGENAIGTGRLAEPAGVETPEFTGNSINVFALPPRD